MWRDPIVEEVRRLREDRAARFNHDLKAISRDLRQRQKTGGRKGVSLRPKRIAKVARARQPAALGGGCLSVQA